MVLLTSSAVSIVLSGGIIFSFTFLLFLSGYVIQQQHVRSLQEALRRPAPHKPVFYLPDQFRPETNENDFVVIKKFSEHNPVNGSDGPVDEEDELGIQSRILQDAQQKLEDGGIESAQDINTVPVLLPKSRLAYAFSLTHPSTLCSAMLFAKWQREYSKLKEPPNIIFLYPATWETEVTPQHESALEYMRQMQETYSLIYHPVRIADFWHGLDVEGQLLNELRMKEWDYDRVLHLQSPGLALDIDTIDKTLAYSNLKASWMPLTAKSLTAKAGSRPDVVLRSTERGFLAPVGQLRRLAVSTVKKNQSPSDEMALEAMASTASYVIFDENDLRHRKGERVWFGGLFERFERDRNAMCDGREILLQPEEKQNPKKKR